MLADSQHSTRLTHNTGVIYRRLYLRLGQIVTYEELNFSLHIQKETVREYVSQINKRVTNVQVRNVRGVGFVMTEKNIGDN